MPAFHFSQKHGWTRIRTPLLLLAAISAFGSLRCAADENVLSPNKVQAISTGKYLVGVYYFPGWISDKVLPDLRPRWLANWPDIQGLPDSRSPHLAWPEREPLLGYYPEEKQWVADWHIKWMVEHGISLVIYDWYWDATNRRAIGEHAVLNYLRSPFRKNLRFGLLWDPPTHPLTVQNCLDVARYWIEHYFNHPEFLKIDAKPVVIIHGVPKLQLDAGSSIDGVNSSSSSFVRRALEEMRKAAIQAGYSGIYFVACAEPASMGSIVEQGFDAATGYNYPLAGVTNPKAKVEPYDTMIAGYEAIWEGFRNSRQIPYLVPTIAGWDPRPFYGDKSIIRVASTPQKFKTMLEAARSFIDRNPDLTKRIVLIEAWNEFGEGSYIEPTVLWRFGYLEAIRAVFGRAENDHQDFAPEGLPRFDY